MAKVQEAVGGRSWLDAARDPFWAVWRLLTSVRFALGLIIFLALAGLLGVLLPQIPVPLRGDAVAVAAWVDFQRGKFGPFTDIMYHLGLFNVFGALWFQAALGVLAIAVAVCTSNRFPAIWRTIAHPPRRVSDAYFLRARHRVSFTTPPEPGALERTLRRHRYRVERYVQGEDVYLFAQRFQWAQLGTFATHLALVLFLVGALVSRLTGFERQLFIAEGGAAPVHPLGQAKQLVVQVEDAVGTFNEEGLPLDYRTLLVIYEGGKEVKRGYTTVNDPLTYGGYRFHQAAYYAFGAGLQVRDLRSGNVIYQETLALADTMPGPRLIISDEAGQVLLDATLALTDLIETALGTTITVPGSQRSFWVGVKPAAAGEEWQLVVFELGGGPDAVRTVIEPGGTAQAGGLRFRFVGVNPLPASFQPDVPLPPGVGSSDGQGLTSGTVLLQMSNAVYGSSQASGGRPVAAPAAGGPPTLSLVGIGPTAISLQPGQSATVGDYEYTFLGQREWAGITVKRDQGDRFIWAAAGLLLLGLAVTFYVPRRRLWARITDQRTYLAGTAGHLVNFSREMRRLGAEAGSPDAQVEEEEE